MRTIETTVYTFDELSDSAKEKALDNHRNREVEYDDWWDCTYDNFVEQAALKGYSIQPKDIHFSGFWSQGDGACFTGSVRKTSEETLALLPCDLAAEIKLHHAKCRLLEIDPINLELTARIITNNSHYSHSNTMEIVETAIEDENWGRCNMGPCFCSPNWPDVCDERDELIRKLGLVNFDYILREEAKDLADELYKSLEEEHEYLTSDEYIAEGFRVRDDEFTEDGESI
jgi:hypothetical protein